MHIPLLPLFGRVLDQPDNHVVFKRETEAMADDLHAPVNLLQKHKTLVDCCIDEKPAQFAVGRALLQQGLASPSWRPLCQQRLPQPLNVVLVLDSFISRTSAD